MGRPKFDDRASTMLRMKAELFDKVKVIADAEERSQNAQIIRFVQEGIQRYEEANGKIQIPEE